MIRDQNISLEEFELIETYLLKNMSEEESNAFALRLSSDKTLEDKVNEVRLLSLAIQEVTLTEKLESYHSELSASIKPRKAIVVKMFSIRRILMAASLIIVVGIGVWLLSGNLNKNDKLFSRFYKPDSGLISAMGTSDNYTFDRAMIDYKMGKYEAAIKSWEGLQTAKPNNDTLSYFLGSAWLAITQADKAIPYLQRVTASPNSAFVHDAYWYLALAQLQQGKKKEAISSLQKSDHPNRDALLMKLKGD